MSIFSPCPPTGIFAPCTATGTTTQDLVIFSAAQTINSAGEVLLSYAATQTLRVDLQPAVGNFKRFLAGTQAQPEYTAYYPGFASVATGQRTSAYAQDLEIDDVRHFGDTLTEIDLRSLR